MTQPSYYKVSEIGFHAGSPPPYLDVNGDNQISPLDVLILVNYLNNRVNGEGASIPTQSVARPTALVDAVFAQYNQAMAPTYDDADELRGRGRKSV